ncbi:MAG: hypothetical protein VXY51_10445 [Pseudomonadota bacterium]|nr:hypothetical protein [Pseudomonadota bacterium]MEC8550490.1 hypothetical protein [Pseudomonadota bacterium]
MKLRFHRSQYSAEAQLIIQELEIYEADLCVLHQTVDDLRQSAEALSDLTLPEHAIAIGINQLADAVQDKERKLFKEYQNLFGEKHKIVLDEEYALIIQKYGEESA